MGTSDLGAILDFAQTAIWWALGLVAIYGVFCVVLLVRRVGQKRFSSNVAAEQFLGDVHDQLRQKNFDAIVEICDSPPFWSKAVPQLMMVALEHRDRGPNVLRRLLGERFEREILADLEYRTSWIATLVKSAPMLGLLGTVVGMINAFSNIAAAQASGVNPKDLADDISFALFTTAAGLTIAIPLVLAGNMLRVRIGKLQDSVQDHLGRFVDDLSTVVAPNEESGS